MGYCMSPGCLPRCFGIESQWHHLKMFKTAAVVAAAIMIMIIIILHEVSLNDCFVLNLFYALNHIPHLT